MARRKRVRLVRNPTHADQLPYNEWIPVEAVKFNEDGSTQVRTVNRGRRRNVAAGFYDDEGIFHPLRASFDYKPARVGERAKRKKAKAKRRRRR